MPTIIVKASSDCGFCCNFDGWPSSEDEGHWKKVVASLLRLAVHGRNLRLVTLSPQPWSFGVNRLEPRTIVVEGERYLLNSVSHCTDEVLRCILDSEEFYRGLVWLLPEFDEDDMRAISYTKNNEVVSVHDDGRTFEWLRPYQPSKTLLELVQRVAPPHWVLRMD